MHFMNSIEIDMARDRYRNHPVLGKATRFLADFRDLIDSVSDGWCYWRPPVKSADKLMTMIENPQSATDDVYRKSLVPIKSFCTRHKLAFPQSGN